jgi:hypothetical protein
MLQTLNEMREVFVDLGYVSEIRTSPGESKEILCIAKSESRNGTPDIRMLHHLVYVSIEDGGWNVSLQHQSRQLIQCASGEEALETVLSFYDRLAKRRDVP